MHSRAERERVVVLLLLLLLVAASGGIGGVAVRGGGGGCRSVHVPDTASCWFVLAAAAAATALVGVGRRFDAADRRVPRDYGTADRAEWLVCRGVVEILPEAARVEEVLAFEPVESKST